MSKRIRKILIANRGEIAQRVQRTCRGLGLAHVAVFSDADANMPFVCEADEAIRIGPAEVAASYLNVEAILEAAKRSGADAVHPGYGFLSENASFARRVAAAGLVFIGPPPEVIESVGLKREAKELVAGAGVPVVPGYDGADETDEAFLREASAIGYPVLLKASAGGGGKGMKRVDRPEQLSEALASARREAKKAFGDDVMLLEKYLASPRHVEVQIFGDSTGRVVHFGERDCSVQRRHQKVVEESPAPNLAPELRSALLEAAVRVGEAIGYRNAGTVEFIVEADRFYFLEVNARLQVEHPVTECVFGVDLVALQIAVANGDPLPASEPSVGGHAIEARLYAEDEDYLPQTGTLADWHFPEAEGVRVDGGFETGSTVGVHYDPMLAKVIGFGKNREEARCRLVGALRRASILGLETNRDVLISILEHDAFVSGDVHTHFLVDHAIQAAAPTLDVEAIAVATLDEMFETAASRTPVPSLGSGFSNNPRLSPEDTWTVGERAFECRHQAERDGSIRLTIGERDVRIKCLERSRDQLRVDLDGRQFSARVRWAEDRAYVSLLGENIRASRTPRFPAVRSELPSGALLAPMPGTVISVDVELGKMVKAGDRLVTVEAMKMEHVVCASEAGVVEELCVAVGDQVEADALLVRIDSAKTT